MPRDHIVGYADRISVAPGDTISFMVSAVGATSFDADIVRIRCGDLNPEGPGFQETVIDTPASGTYPTREQPCRSGSAVRVPPSPVLDALSSFTVQATIWPTTTVGRRQALLGTWDDSRAAGFAVVIETNGTLGVRISDGSGEVFALDTGVALVTRRWAFVAATYDAATGTVTLVQEPVFPTGPGDVEAHAEGRAPHGWRAAPGAAFLMAAWSEGEAGGKPLTGGHYNGKIERPRLAARAFDRLEMERARADAIPRGLTSDIVGWWDFALGIPTTIVRDLSRNRLDGRLVNLPARGMTGSNWTGEEDNFNHAPQEYGAIHFHDDDIYDAGWEPSVTLTVPDDLPSGVYACRVTGGGMADRIPFFVRPPRGTATARVAFLASTATYLAYANLNPVPFEIAELLSGRLLVVHEANRLIDEHPEWGPSLYDVHSDGSGVCYSSWFRPILNIRPGYVSQFGGQGSSLREFNADTHILDWLEATGTAFDVITDHDLHVEGHALLARYAVVMTGTHPEYFSSEMWDATKAYTDGGGRLMVMGGNGFYWRVGFHSELPGVMEVRRSGPAIRTWETQPGEAVQSFDGRRGGLWRALGRAPQSIGGVGFVAEGFDLGTYYRRTPESRDPRAAFIFEGLADDELIGDFGLQGGGAAGVEIDRADISLGTPPHALVLATSEGHSESYRIVNEEVAIMIPNVTAPTNARIAADMVFFEATNGGAVFNTGSIAWSGSLSHAGYDNNVSRITGNVLRRFLDDTPFG